YMLSNKKNLRLAAAVGLYKKGEVTLGKAAEIADVGILEFKERLKEYGIKRIIEAESASKMDSAIEKIKSRYG
ncbi:MAG: UPF0175 family protein, partial [Thaumarchaeota archaeon]|nr:UPF0175 family protein [Nitrososphaerota archaeon]